MGAKRFRILLFARNSSQDMIQQYLDQLRKMQHAYETFQIYLYTKQCIEKQSDLKLHQFQSLQKLWRYVENPRDQFDLVIVDDMSQSNLTFLLSMMLYHIPLVVEQQFTQIYGTYLISNQSVYPYSREDLSGLIYRLIGFLRNFKVKMALVDSAYRLAQSYKRVIYEGMSWQDDEELTSNEENEMGVLDGVFRWKRKKKLASLRLSDLKADQNKYKIEDKNICGKETSELKEVDSASHREKQGSSKRYSSHVDLVIISYNTLSYLRDCIQSIRNYTRCPYRLIVVDNGSTDGSTEFLHREQNITVIENKENHGYARACNQGIMIGDSEFLVILNTDVKVSSGWLTEMIKTAHRDPMIGVVGPKMVNAQNQIVGAGVTKLDQYCSGRGWLDPDGIGVYDRQEDCFSVGGACYMIRRSVLEQVGAFDGGYFFYFEESDLSLRIIEKGYRVVYAPQAKIVHHHEGSLNPRDYKGRLQRNAFFQDGQKRFMRKWEAVLNGAAQREGKKDLIIFGVIPWDFRYQRPQQICSRLAEQGYRVLYINNICHQGGRLTNIERNLYSFSPDGWGIAYHSLPEEEKALRIILSIYDVMEKLDFYNVTIWVDVPYWQQIIPYFDRISLTYNCMDSYEDFSDLQEYCPNLKSMEEELAKSADLIFASSKVLFEKMRQLNQDTYLIPNGVDREHFSLIQEWEAPEEIRNISKPIIGYYGAIAEWFDIDLIDYVTNRFPEYSFVFIGRSTIELKNLDKKPNVYFLGEKPYQELPKYVQHFQATLIPFKQNKLTESTNPVKLYEYLATGKPVISVDLPEIHQFQDVVYIGKDYKSFASYLKEAMNREGWWVKRKRKRAVRNEDWNQRVNDIIKLLKQIQKRNNRVSRILTLNQEIERKGG